MEYLSAVPAFTLVSKPGEPNFHQQGVLINRRWFLSFHSKDLEFCHFRVFAEGLSGEKIHRAFFAHSWRVASLHRDLVELSESTDGPIVLRNRAGFEKISVFFLLSLNCPCEDLGQVRRDLAAVEALCTYPSQGSRLLAAHSPYVNAGFLNLVTEAVVSKTFRSDSSIFLTDCKIGWFSSGASLFRNESLDERMRLIVGMVLFPASADAGHDYGFHFAATFRSISLSGASSIQMITKQLPSGVTDFGASNASKRVVMVCRGKNLGSGVVIGRNYVVTCAHVVSDDGIISLQVNGVLIENVELKLLLEIPDIALLEVHETRNLLEPVEYPYTSPYIGDEVGALGYPGLFSESSPTLSRGVVSGISWKCIPGCQSIFTSCSIVKGYSGGGLFTCDGRWIGLICLSTKTVMPAINMALGVTSVAQYLRENGYSDIPLLSNCGFRAMKPHSMTSKL